MRLTFCICTLAVAANTHAKIVAFDTFGPGDTYDTTAGALGIGQLQDPGAQFFPSVSGNIATIDLALGFVTSPGPIQILLYGDANGSPRPPDIFLGIVTPTIQQGSRPSNITVTLSNVVNVVPIVQGVPYWLVLQSASPDPHVDGAWLTSFTPGAAVFGNPLTQQFQASSIPELPAFRVTVFGQPNATVPDKGSTLMLLGFSGFWTVWLARRIARSRSPHSQSVKAHLLTSGVSASTTFSYPFSLTSSSS